MTFSVLGLSSLHLSGLRLLCTVGSCAGFAVILLGLRLPRDGRGSEQESRRESAGANPEPAEPFLPQKVIRLTTDPAPIRSFEMTQQQKIAAALNRAGVAHPGFSQETNTATTVVAAPSESATKIDTEGETVSSARSNSKRKMFLLLGGVIAALSLILLLALR